MKLRLLAYAEAAFAILLIVVTHWAAFGQVPSTGTAAFGLALLALIEIYKHKRGV